ncbi:MAG: metallophosphoesterase [Deltaproteobacteria bacterium]|nr:metallophosphoesterase [Deltaproteobacteria bacterium]
MPEKKSKRAPQASLSRRDLLKLTGGAVAGTVVACSDGSLLSPPHGDAGDPPLPDAGADAGPVLSSSGHPATPLEADAAVAEHLGPIFLVHFSDIHIGSGSLALPALEFGLLSILPAFPLIPVLATGDLIEVGNDVDDWVDYQNAIDGAGLNAEDFIEIPGNHDALLDGNLSNYLLHTLAGRNGHGTCGLYHRLHQGRRIRIVALNTCSAGNPIQDSTGYLQQSQVDELIEQINQDAEPVYATIVLGHHPPSSPLGLGLLGTDVHLRTMLDHTAAAAYLHGHLHMHYTNWEGKTLMAQAPSLGNPSENMPGAEIPGFNIFAIDDGPVAKPVFLSGDSQSLTVDWPLVMITKPANLNLGKSLTSNTPNPWAQPLPRNSTGNVLHAGVFAPSQTIDVRYQVDGQAWHPMTQVTDYFMAEFDSPDKDSCVITVEAEVLGGGIQSDTIEVELA